jgi:hypothetical protein
LGLIDGHGVSLDVHAPADAQPVLTALFGEADRPPSTPGRTWDFVRL